MVKRDNDVTPSVVSLDKEAIALAARQHSVA